MTTQIPRALQAVKKTEQEVSEPEVVVKNMDNEGCAKIGVLCCGGCSLLAISVGMLTWVIMSIIMLVKYPVNDIKDDCPDSYIWECLCVMVSLTGARLLFQSKNKNKDKDGDTDIVVAIINAILQIIIAIGLVVWCGVELFRPCAYNNYAWSMPIWECLFAVFVVNCVVIIVLIIALCLLMKKCWHVQETSTSTGFNHMDV